MRIKKAHYDTYDYPAYWEGRDYEHESEIIVIKHFLGKIPKIYKILDIGAGYGRIAPYYIYRAKKVVLADPSSKLLEEAKKRIDSLKDIMPGRLRQVSFVQTSTQDLTTHFKKAQFDLVLMVRVMHHIADPESTIEALSHAVSPNGHLILEFANKIHGKATITKLLKGDFTYPMDIFPVDRKTTKDNKSIDFYNYHPHIIKYLLKKHGFKIQEVRSVSNIRSTYLKKHLPCWALTSIEKLLQKPLAHIYFGPSIFILAKKRA
jgi:2-polyprenyl-3-methyl-5-hydroxy-6-metoxy-1,4-benzoquinol methylase